ncbi:MAG: hypothetical protein ACTHM6_05330 [Tepidisphaeraceae bacterium]
MGRSRRERILLFTAVFGWPVAVVAGWGVSWATAGRVPLAVFPIIWLIGLGVLLTWMRGRESSS